MPTANPAADLAAHLAGTVNLPSGGTKTLTAGTNLFRGPVRAQDSAIPAEAVFVLEQGGAAPQPYLGGASDYANPSVVVYVRGAVDDFDGGEDLARGVLRKLHRAAVSGYVAVLAESSEPAFLGSDERGLWKWSITVGLQLVR